MALPQKPDSEARSASAPANGPPSASPTIRVSPALPRAARALLDLGDSYLHSNPYPNTAAPGQPAECEAGNEDYGAFGLANKQAIGNPPGDQGTVQRAHEAEACR